MTTQPLNVCLLGAPLDTGNLGVSALGESTLAALMRREHAVNATVFDNGLGTRTGSYSANGRSMRYTKRGIRISRRFWRGESLMAMRVAMTTHMPNHNLEALRDADVVLDISGGDSFTDLYGRRRFELVARPKLIALQLGKPLVLLPQTYGPFSSAASRATAAHIVRSARSAWARDPDSFRSLRELLGDAFDPQRHRQGVDVAFALPTSKIKLDELGDPVKGWLKRKAGEQLVGMNVSGLLANDPGSTARFGLRVDYRPLMVSIASKLLAEESTVRVVLLPHVVGDTAESDTVACRALRGEIESSLPSEAHRVAVVGGMLTAGTAKQLISSMDWFLGTRMHSTIAALSSGVPTAALAYSLKTRGVFDTCGQASAVADGRKNTNDEARDTVLHAWHSRADIRETLAGRAPAVVAMASNQWDMILPAATRRRSRRR